MVATQKKWTLLFTKQSMNDAKKIASADLTKNANKILDVLENNPYQNPPPFEKLLGDLQGCYSRRINIQHRIVYEIDPIKQTVLIFRTFSHYGE